MDIQDVPHPNKYAETLLTQKDILIAAGKRQGEIPNDRSSPEELCYWQMTRRFLNTTKQFADLTIADDGSKALQTSFITRKYAPSYVSLGRLQKMAIKDLQLEINHRGKFILVRAMTPPLKMTATILIAEDEEGEATTLQIFHFDGISELHGKSRFKKHDVMIIKEPYFKVMADGEYGLHVDHVTDLIRIEKTSDQCPPEWRTGFNPVEETAIEFKHEGNWAVERDDYDEAIRCYDSGLKCNPTEKTRKEILEKRALAHNRNDEFDVVLEDVEYANGLPNASIQELFGASDALYGLRRFVECHDVLSIILKRFPGNVTAMEHQLHVKSRIEEQETGVYDFKALHYEAENHRPLSLDHATFIGPVRAQESVGRGRGLFTTKAVKAGELLLCEKAFAHCFAGTAEESDGETLVTPTISINVNTNKITVGTQGSLITKIVQKLWKNPSLSPIFLDLNRGSCPKMNETDNDGNPIVDSFLVEHIISLNVFGCPLSSREAESQQIAEMKRLRYHSCGIWPTASLINHSCVSNVERSFIGDFQLVRATQDVPAETELFCCYTSSRRGTYGEKQEELRPWGFSCECIVCLDDKDTGKKVAQKRNCFSKDFEALMKGKDAKEIDEAKVERLVVELDKTHKRPYFEVPSVRIYDAYVCLYQIYANKLRPEKMMFTALKALGALGFVIEEDWISMRPDVTFIVKKWGLLTDMVVHIFMRIGLLYEGFAPGVAEIVKNYAKLAYKMGIGEDETFDEFYKAQTKAHVKKD